MFDWIIKGGTVYDGSGGPPREADVGICGDRIAAVGDLSAGSARNVFDAGGMVVSPGFIDSHSHSDFGLVAVPTADNKIRQGITTEIVGQCGFSAAPLSDAVTANSGLGTSGLDDAPDWCDMAGYAGRLESGGIALNAGCLVGHNNLRIMAMNMEQRAADPADLQKMQQLLGRAIDQGALGMSTGLLYVPGAYASPEELQTLGRFLAERGSLYVTHIRDEGNRVIESVEEAIEVARRCGCRVLISHHKAAGKSNWGKVKRTIELMKAAREEEGLDVQCDAYPYRAGSAGITALLPPWVQAGGVEMVLERVADPGLRPSIRAEVDSPDTDWANEVHYAGWDGIMVSQVGDPGLRHCVGRSIQELADEAGQHPTEYMLDLVLRDRAQTRYVIFFVSDEDLETVFADPHCAVGTDAGIAAPGTSRTGKRPMIGSSPHPRGYGTFPRFIRRYVLDSGMLSMGEAVRKMTLLPASTYGLHHRGMLAEGWYADVTVFDPETIRDRATYLEPHQYPEGISSVWVNGTRVFDGSAHTRELPGRVLRREDS